MRLAVDDMEAATGALKLGEVITYSERVNGQLFVTISAIPPFAKLPETARHRKPRLPNGRSR